MDNIKDINNTLNNLPNGDDPEKVVVVDPYLLRSELGNVTGVGSAKHAEQADSATKLNPGSSIAGQPYTGESDVDIALDNLSDVTIANPGLKNVLTYDTSAPAGWKNKSLDLAYLSDMNITTPIAARQTLVFVDGRWTNTALKLDDLFDVNSATNLTANQVLQYNGTEWVNTTLSIGALLNLPSTSVGYVLSYNGTEWVGRQLNIEELGHVRLATGDDLKNNQFLVYDKANGVWVNHTLTFGDFSELQLSNPKKNHTLVYNGTGWVNEVLDLADLGDVKLSTTLATPTPITANDILIYSDAQGKWINRQFAFSDISDIEITALENGHLLVYDSASGKWKNRKLSANDISDLSIQNPQQGQVPVYSGQTPQFENKAINLKLKGDYIEGTGTLDKDGNLESTPTVKLADVAKKVQHKLVFPYTDAADGQLKTDRFFDGSNDLIVSVPTSINQFSDTQLTIAEEGDAFIYNPINEVWTNGKLKIVGKDISGISNKFNTNGDLEIAVTITNVPHADKATQTDTGKDIEQELAKKPNTINKFGPDTDGNIDLGLDDLNDVDLWGTYTESEAANNPDNPHMLIYDPTGDDGSGSGIIGQWVNIPISVLKQKLKLDKVENKSVADIVAGLPNKLYQLGDVQIPLESNEGDVLEYDASIKRWVNRPNVLSGLNDVSVITPKTNQVLAYDEATKRWKNMDSPHTKALAQLTNDVDVTTSAPTANQSLVFNGTKWVNKQVPIDELAKTAISGPTTGQVLTFDGTNWKNQSIPTSAKTIPQLDDCNTVGTAANPYANKQVLTYDGSKWVNKNIYIGGTHATSMSDVVISDAANGQVLTYQDGNWVNKAVTQAATPPSAPPMVYLTTKTGGTCEQYGEFTPNASRYIELNESKDKTISSGIVRVLHYFPLRMCTIDTSNGQYFSYGNFGSESGFDTDMALKILKPGIYSASVSTQISLTCKNGLNGPCVFKFGVTGDGAYGAENPDSGNGIPFLTSVSHSLTNATASQNIKYCATASGVFRIKTAPGFICPVYYVSNGHGTVELEPNFRWRWPVMTVVRLGDIGSYGSTNL